MTGRLRRGALVLLPALVALLGGAAPAHAVCPDENLPWSSGELERLRNAVVCLVNEERAARRVPGVRREAHLDAAAQGHADDMVQRGYFDHNTPPGHPMFPYGADFCSRLQGYGYDDCGGVVEDLGQSETPLTEVRGNIEDAEHCSPIIQSSRDEIGIGVRDGRWVFDFGAEHREQTAVLCPDKLARDGGAVRTPSIPFDRPIVGRTSVVLPLLCMKGGDTCRLSWRVRRGPRVETRATATVAEGRRYRLTVRLTRAGLRAVRRNGKVTINVQVRVKGISELLYDRDFTLFG